MLFRSPLAATFEKDTTADGGLKVAMRSTGDDIVTSQTDERPHDPDDQPAKVEPAGHSATSRTDVPYLRVTEHVPGQLMPPPETPPVPRPVTSTVRTCGASNVADTDLAAFIVTVQSPTTPEHAPLPHPVKTDWFEASGVAVNVTTVFGS